MAHERASAAGQFRFERPTNHRTTDAIAPASPAPKRTFGPARGSIPSGTFSLKSSVGACQSSDRVQPRTGTTDRWVLRNRCLLRADSR